MSQYVRELEVATSIAKAAGEVMLKYADGDQHILSKSDNSPVTIADTEINHMAIEQLAQHFPGDGIIGEEESTAEYGPGRRWICDPIDGTKGYTYGMPTAMFSLGLAVDGQPVLGVAYNPFTGWLYTAETGQGSFRNGRRLHVNDKTITNGVIGVASSANDIYNQPSYLAGIMQQESTLVGIAGIVFACGLVANGRIVAYVKPRQSPHDVAAMHVIVEEAGGKVTAQDGSSLDYTKPFDRVLISNGTAHAELIKLMAGNA